jgi:hypothetical protein
MFMYNLGFTWGDDLQKPDNIPLLYPLIFYSKLAETGR